MYLLTACMMVKNEEHFLGKCLESLIGLVDEICIIDTGSTDSTKDIIQKFSSGDHGIKVKFKEIPWFDDFAGMRNHTIAMVDNSKFFIVVDADSVITVEDDRTRKDIRDELSKIYDSGKKSAAITLRDWNNNKCVMTCAQACIFTTDIRYKGIIHNSPEYDGDAVLIKGLYVDHYGYDLSKDKMEAKFKRTYSGLMRQLTEDPDNMHTEFYLCQLFGTRGKHKEAKEWGEKYLARHTNGNLISRDINPTIFYSLGRIYLDLKDIDSAAKMCQMGFAFNPLDPDLSVIMSDVFFAKGDNFGMAAEARRYLLAKNALSQKGLGPKFYFSLVEEAEYNMLCRIAVCCISEGLNAAISLNTKKGHQADSFKKSMMAQLKEWGLESIKEVIDARSSS